MAKKTKKVKGPNKLNKKEIATGQVPNDKPEDQNSLRNVRTLDEIMKRPVKNPFGSTDEKAFEKKIDSMNLADMQTLATRVDINPVHDRQTLRKRLMAAFRAKIRSMTPYDKIDVVNPNEVFSDNEELGEKARKILNRGR